MINQQQIIILVAAFSFIGVTFAYGYHVGTINQIKKYEQNRQLIQNELLDLNESISVKNAEILRLNQEKKGLINELENQAINANGSAGPGIATTGGLQRLERRWGSSTTSP